MSADQEKQAAAEAAAELVENGMTVGLGTGSTAAFLVQALGRRSLDIRCVATSPRTEEAAKRLVTLPLYGHMGDEAVERVAAAVVEAVRSERAPTAA